MTRFSFTNKAIKDLSEIWNYTYDYWSEHQADIYYQMLMENCREIADNPKLGKNYKGIINRLHGLTYLRTLILAFITIISRIRLKIKPCNGSKYLSKFQLVFIKSSANQLKFTGILNNNGSF